MKLWRPVSKPIAGLRHDFLERQRAVCIRNGFGDRLNDRTRAVKWGRTVLPIFRQHFVAPDGHNLIALWLVPGPPARPGNCCSADYTVLRSRNPTLDYPQC